MVSLASRPERDGRAGARRAAALHWLESWGDYVAGDGVARADAAHDGAGADRRQAGRGQVDRRHPPRRSAGRPSGSEDGQGAAAVGELRGHRAGRVGRPRPAGGARPGRPAEFWEESLRRGGAWREAARPPRSRSGPRPGARGGAARARGRRLARAHRSIPSARFYDGRGGGPAVAAGGARHDDPGRLGRLGRGPAETAKQLGVARGDLVSLTSPARQRSSCPPTRPSSLHPGAVAVAMGQGHSFAGAYAERGCAASTWAPTRSRSSARAGRGRLGRAAATSRSRCRWPRRAAGGRWPSPRPTYDQDDREIAQHVRPRRRPRARAPRQAARAREPPDACTRRSSTRSTAGA